MKKILLSGLLAVLLTCSACAGTGGVKVATESASSSQAAASSAAAETTGTAEPVSEVTSTEHLLQRSPRRLKHSPKRTTARERKRIFLMSTVCSTMHHLTTPPLN